MYGLTPMMESMLRHLAHYKYLTVSHVMALNIGKSKDRGRKYFLAMMKEGLVDRQVHFGVSENAKKKGFLQRHRQEYLRHLTPEGAKFLDKNTDLDLSNIRYPKRAGKRLKNDYFHRVSTIFTHISFERRVEESGGSDVKVLLYYDNTNKQLTKSKFDAETRLSLGGNKHYSPDMICSYVDANNEPHVFCIEVYNGNKVGRVVGQLEKLFAILDTSKRIEQRIGVDVVPRILVTFDNENLLAKVKERIQDNPVFAVEGIEDLLYFSSDIEIWNSFSCMKNPKK